MKIMLVTDAWMPQVNGVVTTLNNTRRYLGKLGYQVEMVTPEPFRTIACPTYPEIRLAVRCRKRVAEMIRQSRPDAIHIATEGPLGSAARSFCLQNGIPFATSYHTRFPEYLAMRLPVPKRWTYHYLRQFHGAAETTLVRSAEQRRELEERGFENLQLWPGAVDTELFYPRGRDALQLPRPISMYMGRISVEKNLDKFLELDLPGSKVLVGDGPDLARLQRRYPEAHFTGARFGEALAEVLSAADVFVFPSRTDTLGLVMLEAMACGVPVAAYPVTGPLEVVREGANGALDEDLRAAVFRALAVAPSAVMESAQDYSWYNATQRFLAAQTATGLGPLWRGPLASGLGPHRNSTGSPGTGMCQGQDQVRASA